jgi:hypothetical protein
MARERAQTRARARARAGFGATVAAAGVALAIAGGAFAFWSGTGDGSAQTRLGDPQPLALSAGTPSALLYPGEDVSVSVVATNPNPYLVHIASLALDAKDGTGGFDVDTGHSACDVSSLAFATQSNNATGWTVPPKSGSADGALPIDMDGALSMGANGSNACQGAVFTVHLLASR